MKIPTNLKPGDRLWYSKTEHATVAESPNGGAWVYAPDRRIPARILATVGEKYLNYCLDDGREIFGDSPPIIRIERIASAKTKREKVPTKSEVWWGNFNLGVLRGINYRRRDAWKTVRADVAGFMSERKIRQCFTVKKVTVTWQDDSAIASRLSKGEA